MFARTLAVISLFLVVCGSSSGSSVNPHHYSVEFRVDIENGNEIYNGTVWIDIEVLKAVDHLELQARNLAIEEVSLTSKEVVHATKSSGSLNRTLVLNLDEELPVGSYQLKIVFNGSSSDYDEMFKGSYKRDDGSTGYYLMSKPGKADFNDGSSAFPHFGDEFMTTFSISVVHCEKLKAWSNMPLQDPPKPATLDHFVMSSFQKTPEMHVHDVGFFVADFGSQKFGNVTVVARDEVLQSTQYVATLGNDLVRIMDEHTAVDYTEPIPDYVYIVLPRKLSFINLTEFERMFVEERYMVYDRKKDGVDQLAKVFERASYKIMLQWLGNLISHEEERLHQAFSNVYTYFNAEKVYPEERIMMLYQLEVVQGSLWYDYESPSCVLNMFWLMVLDDKWRDVMRNLMKNRKPRTLTTEQLFSEAQKLWPEDYNVPDGMTLATIVNQWMYSDERPPILNVQRLYSEKKVTLSQNGSEKILPYNYATETSHFNQLGPFQWLTGPNDTVQFDVSDDHWLVVNKEEFGYYRVNYDEPNWRLITKTLKSNISSIHRFSRMQLLDDGLYFAENDLLDITIFLELLTYLRGEDYYVAWYNAYDILTSGYYPEVELPNVVKTFFLHLIEPYYNTFASLEISTTTPQMELDVRSQISEIACWIGMEDCLRQARTRFLQAVSENVAVEPNWSEVIYCYGLQNATDEELEWLLKTTDDWTRSVEYLVCVDNEVHLRRVLEELIKNANLGTITRFIQILDETGFRMLHSLLKNDSDLVQLLGSARIEYCLQAVSKTSISAKTLALIDDLEKALELNIAEKGSGSDQANIWAKPEVADFIERYMNGFQD